MASTVSSGGDCVFEGLSSRVLLRTGLQVVGVIAIVMGVAGLISVVGVVISEEMQPLVLRFGAILAPVFILAAGVYLTIGSKGLVEKLCPDSEEKPESGETLFFGDEGNGGRINRHGFARFSTSDIQFYLHKKLRSRMDSGPNRIRPGTVSTRKTHHWLVSASRR